MRNAFGLRYEYEYIASDEIAFLRGLALGAAKYNGTACTRGWAGRGPNLAAFARYANLVMSGMRAYDAQVNVTAVKAAIVELLAETGMMAA